MANHEWLIIFLVSVDIQDTNNEEINSITKKILTDKFNTEIIEKLKGVEAGKNIKPVLINNIKLISNTIKYTTECFEIVKDTLTPFSIPLPESFQLQDKESLLILLKNIKSSFKATRTIISTYGHGSMFGIFSTRNFNNNIKLTNYKLLEEGDMEYWAMISPYAEKLSLSVDNENINFLVASRQFSNDKYKYKLLSSLESHEIIISPKLPANEGGYEKFKVLSNEEFAWAIKESFGKIDFLVFNNCVMQNIYTQYSFKDVTDYLVAPATGIVYPCFNLKGIINYLDKNTSASNEEVSQMITESFKEKNNSEYINYKSVIEEFIVVSIRLNKLDIVFDLLKELKLYLQKELTGVNKNIFACAIANSLEETYPMEYNTFTGETIFDLVQVLESDYLKGYETLQTIKQSLWEALTKNAADLHSFIGTTAYEAGYKTYYKNKKHMPVSGLCIYFPKNRNMLNPIIHSYYNSVNYVSSLENGLNWYRDIIESYLLIMQ